MPFNPLPIGRIRRGVFEDSITLKLLDKPLLWRQRSAVRIYLSSALWSERYREVDVVALHDIPAFQEQLVKQYGTQAQEADAIFTTLPIIDMPKVTSVDFCITVADKPVYRLPRYEISTIQAAYFRHYLARRANRENELVGIGLEKLLAAIFLFNPANLKEYLKEYRFRNNPYKWLRSRIDPSYPVDAYITKKFSDFHLDVTKETHRHWQNIVEPITEFAERYVISDRSSSAENPLLAIPMFLKDSGVTQGQVTEILRKLVAFLMNADNAWPDPDNKTLLQCYFGWGLRWEILAHCQVPLNEPFRIIIQERREIFFGRAGDSTKPYWWRTWIEPTASTYISFKDAATNHVHVSATDNGVELKSSDTKSVSEKNNDLEPPDAEHKTAEQYARYDAQRSRESRIWVQCRLRQPWLRRWTARGVCVATLAAFSLILYFGVIGYDADQKLNGGDVVAILIPVTFAASLLLARDATTLGMHVKRMSQITIMLSLGSLWAITVVLYFLDHISIDGNSIIFLFSS